MSYTDMRDFEPEYTVEIDSYLVKVEKLGGGTIGRAYQGTWQYCVRLPDDTVKEGRVYLYNYILTHEEVAHEIAMHLKCQDGT